MNIKYTYSTILVLLFLFIAYGSGSSTLPYGIKSAKNLQSTKDEIDDVYDACQDEYEDFCDGPRNDQMKEGLQTLTNNLVRAESWCYKNENLSYDEQSAASDYALSRIKDYPDLYKLKISGTINCW